MIISLLAAPEINKARERQFLVQKVQSPDTRQLGAGIRVRVVIALKKLLV